MKVTKGNSHNQQHDSKPENFHVNAKVCRLVAKYPCMYDRSHPHYLKKDVVDRAWIKIAKEMDDSISSCKERWRNIRTSFARSINVNKVPASANRTKPYYLHEELQFLAKHITPGIPVSRRSNASVYYSAGEESETIEVSVGGESFDGFANTTHDEEIDEEAGSDNTGEEEEDEHDDSRDIKTETSQPELSQQPQQQQQQRHSMPATVQLNQSNSLTEFERQEPEPAEITTTQIMPPKKRQRTELVLSSPSSLADVEQPDHDMKPPEINSESDFDAIFLQGLLPEMKAMDFRQKILFKRRIYEVIAEVFEATTAAAASTATTTTKPLETVAVSNKNNISHNNNNSIMAPHPIKQGRLVTAHLIAPPAAPTAAATMTVVSASDLAMIRRLNNLLQNPTAASIATISNGGGGSVALNGSLNGYAVSTGAVAATLAKNVAQTMNNHVVQSTAASTPTVTVQRGTLTRANTNLLRVTMVNPPVSVVPTVTNLQQPITVATTLSSTITANTKKYTINGGIEVSNADGANDNKSSIVKEEPETLDD